MNYCRFMAIGLVALFLVGAMVGCGDCPKEGFDGDALKRRIKEANRVFIDAMKKGDVDAVVDLYADDAVILAPQNEIISGKEAITAFWKKAMAGEATFDAVYEVEEVGGDGMIAYEIGKNVSDYTFPDGDKWQERAKFVVVWKKQADGEWKMQVDIWNRTTLKQLEKKEPEPLQ